MSALKKIIMASFLLMSIPFIALFFGWYWRPVELDKNTKILYWITESAGFPWAILTCFLFWLFFVSVMRTWTQDKLFKLTLLLVLSVFVGQGIKSAVKTLLSEPRPYITWLEEHYGIDDDYFYSLPRNERAELLDHTLAGDRNVNIPPWALTHWRNETGYSLPSGHALFAIYWALLAVGLLRFRQHYITISLIVSWAWLIELSRLYLGMHWPIDLIIGNMIALIIVSVVCFFAKKWDLITT